MDFGFTEEQEAVRDAAAQVLEGQVTQERLKEVEAGGEGFDRDTWARLATARNVTAESKVCSVNIRRTKSWRSSCGSLRLPLLSVCSPGCSSWTSTRGPP